jgi:hypothetical protein
VALVVPLFPDAMQRGAMRRRSGIAANAASEFVRSRVCSASLRVAPRPGCVLRSYAISFRAVPSIIGYALILPLFPDAMQRGAMRRRSGIAANAASEFVRSRVCGASLRVPPRLGYVLRSYAISFRAVPSIIGHVRILPLSRTRCSAERCGADPGSPQTPHRSFVRSRVCGAAPRAAPRPGYVSSGTRGLRPRCRIDHPGERNADASIAIG